MELGPPPAPRRALHPPVRVENVPSGRRPSFLGYAANLSETGLFVQCVNPRPEGTRLRVRLHLPMCEGGPLVAEAEVRWTRGYSGKLGPSAGMGLALMDLPDDITKRLREYCDH